MALSDYDKKYLDKRQQQAVLTYTAQYERAIREGNQKAAQMAHEGAEAIRRLAGYSGGGEGDSFLKPAAAVSKTISVSTNGKTSYQTVPAASAATVERADKLPTPSATRQDRSSRGGGFGSTRAGGFGGTGGSTSLATRIGQGAVSGLAEAGALLSATAGTAMDVRGGTGMTPVYREQTQALTRQIDALEKELRDPALTARERQDANDALRIAREQRNVYTQATAANQGTAQKLYETTDEGLRYAREQAEKSVRGTSGLEREVLSRVPGMTQNAAITGLNLVAPWLGTTTAVLADAGAAETRYRHDSGADYDAKAAAARGARVIGGDTARIIAGELVRDYAETLRELYAERRRRTAPPLLAEPDRPRLPQSAYADALSRLEDSNGTDLTKPVSAYSAPPSVIELPETLGDKSLNPMVISEEIIGRSLGAKAKNYDILDLSTGSVYHLAEGTRLQNVEVFAGKGTRTEFRDAEKYSRRYGGDINSWQHAKGIGIVSTPDGGTKAELHWIQCEGIGKKEMFVKEWLE